MEVSGNPEVENNLKENREGSGKEGSVEVEVEEVDFGEVIELPPEPVITKQDAPDPEFVGVIQAVEEEAESLNLASGNIEQKVEEEEKEAVVSSDLPVSDTNAEASSGVPDSAENEVLDDDADPSVPTSDATVGGGVPQVSEEIPRSIEDDHQPSTTFTGHQTRASWLNCCGLLDVVRGSNQ